MCVCVCMCPWRPRQMLPDDTHTWRAHSLGVCGGLGGPAHPLPCVSCRGSSCGNPSSIPIWPAPRESRGCGRGDLEQEPRASSAGSRRCTESRVALPPVRLGRRCHVCQEWGWGRGGRGGLGAAFRPERRLQEHGAGLFGPNVASDSLWLLYLSPFMKCVFKVPAQMLSHCLP